MLIFKQTVCQLIYQSKGLILLASPYKDLLLFETAGKSQQVVTSLSCPEFTNSSDVAPTLAVV